MKGKLPRITAGKVTRVLEKAGFVLVHQIRSHKIYKNSEEKSVTAPYHTKKVLHPKVLKIIIRDADLTVERFIKLME